jgi:hypothetical protein
MVSLKSKIRRFRLTQLQQIRVAAPCAARWEEMEGDEKVRFCEACRLHVYNLSAMDVEEAADRISQEDGRLCVRFYRRNDGTILTRDCPAGVEDARQRRRKVVWGAAAAVLGLGAASGLGTPGTHTMGVVAPPDTARPGTAALEVPELFREKAFTCATLAAAVNRYIALGEEGAVPELQTLADDDTDIVRGFSLNERR